jgi:5'-nucleotidase
MRALITNDDGIDSAGISALTRVALDAGLTVTVAAPHEERSGSSAALSALEQDGRLLLEERRLDGLKNVTAFAVHASPALIVFAAVREAFGEPPDVVLSGINHGPNTGVAVLHSGTVGAALTAATHGIAALAVSMATTEPTNWDTAAAVTTKAVAWLQANRAAPLVLNVNVPDLPSNHLRGLRRAALSSFGAVQAKIGERGQGYVTVTYEEINALPTAETDAALLRDGWATATALQAPCEVRAIDLSALE